MDKVRNFFGRFHYNKWVVHYRYKQQFDDSAAPIWNLAFFTMFAGMLVDNHARSTCSAVCLCCLKLLAVVFVLVVVVVVVVVEVAAEV